MQLITEGRNRFVILTDRHAIKVPSLRSWRDFLFGLLNNMREAQACHDHPALCPVRIARASFRSASLLSSSMGAVLCGGGGVKAPSVARLQQL